MNKAFYIEYGDARYDLDARACIVFAATSGKAKTLGARQLECDFVDIGTCKRAPKFDKYAEKGKLTDRDYIKEGWSIGCPKCEAQTDEYTARFADDGDYVTSCEYCSQIEERALARDEGEAGNAEASLTHSNEANK